MADLERLGDELGSELARHGAKHGMGDIATIVAAWPAAVGDGIARNAWPARVNRDGTLHVNVSSAAWAFELTQLGPDIHEKLRAVLGEATPKALRFAPGTVPSPPADEAALAPKPRVHATPEQAARADEIASGISDPGLREAVARAARASLARGRIDRSL